MLWRIIPSSWLDHRDSETDLCNKLKSYSWSKQGVESISVLFKVDVPIIQDVSLKQTSSNNLRDKSQKKDLGAMYNVLSALTPVFTLPGEGRGVLIILSRIWEHLTFG